MVLNVLLFLLTNKIFQNFVKIFYNVFKMTTSEILQALNKLPKGDVYVKYINGKGYYYHQWFERGKAYSRHIDENCAHLLKEEINQRKELEKLLKESQSKVIQLSKSMKELTGFVMMGDIQVAKFAKGEMVESFDSLLPLVIKRTHSLEAFLNLRVLDLSRTNGRILKKALAIHEEDDYLIPIYAYALSMTDNYWFKSLNSKLKYKDVMFNNDNFFDMSLKGDNTFFPHKTHITPEITTRGSFEKGWKKIDNSWWLYKAGNKYQIFSELFSSQFAKLIGINTIEYEYDNGYIRSKNFAYEYNFEPMAAIAGENEDYDYVFHLLLDIDENIAKDYLKLIFFDSVINNVDRHNENTGLMRDKHTGKIMSLAPNFDNNLSLVSQNRYLFDDVYHDGFSKVFINFINKDETARNMLKTIEFPNIEESDIKKILDNIPLEIEDMDLPRIILRRYNDLKQLTKQSN